MKKLTLLTWLLYIAADATINWYIIEKQKQNINHLVAFLIRVYIAIVIGGIMLNIQENQFFYWLFAFGGSFWILFDLALNKMRGLDFLYIGENAMIDKFGYKYHLVYWLAKLAVLFTTIISWYRLLNF